MNSRGPLPEILKMPPAASGAPHTVHFPAGAPKAPTHLSRGAKRIWKKLCATLLDARLLSENMWPTAWAFAEALATLAKCNMELNREGYFYKVGKKPNLVKCVHPAVKAQHSAMAAVKLFADAFGLSPAKCLRVAMPKQEDPAPPKPKVFARQR